MQNEEIPKDINAAYTHDVNHLYASCLTTYLPLDNFRILRQEEQNLEFKLIEEKLKNVDLDFFYNLTTERQQGILFRLVLDYDPVACLPMSLDLSMFPRFKSVSANELSQDQRNEAKELGKNLDRDYPKLVSNMERGEVVDFLENILFLLIHQSCHIVEIRQMVVYRQSDYLSDYIHFLQTQRALATSNVEGRIIKALGNSIVGG